MAIDGQLSDCLRAIKLVVGPLAPPVQSGDPMPGTTKFFSSIIGGFDED